MPYERTKKRFLGEVELCVEDVSEAVDTLQPANEFHDVSPAHYPSLFVLRRAFNPLSNRRIVDDTRVLSKPVPDLYRPALPLDVPTATQQFP